MKTWQYRSLKLGLQFHLLEFRRIIQNSQEPCSYGTCLVVFDMSVFREYHETFVPLDLLWLQFDFDLMPLSLPVKLKHRRQTTQVAYSALSHAITSVFTPLHNWSPTSLFFSISLFQVFLCRHFFPRLCGVYRLP